MKVFDRSAQLAELAWLTYPGRVCARFNIDRTPQVRYGLAAGFTLTALALAAAVSTFSIGLMLAVLLAAVLLSAWFGGWRPALVSVTISVAALVTLLLPGLPGHTWTSVGYLIQLGVFLVAASLLSIKLEQAQAAMLRYELEKERNRVLSEDRETLRAQEQEARAEVEAVRKRLTWLASSGSLLVASLDYRLVLERLAHITVENLADWCVIDLATPLGEIDRVAAANSYAPAQALTDRLLDFPPSPQSDHPIARTLASPAPVIAQEVDEDALEAMCIGEPDCAVIRELGCACVAHIPMVARGRTIGVLTVALSVPGARFDSGKLALAQDLSHRAALGIDNARLYKEAQDEIATRRRVEEMLVQHKEEIESLNLRLQRAMTETHHRVKNNLQVIAAMVDLQLMRDEEMIPISEMARLGSHIRTLAGVHDILTRQTKAAGEVEYVSAGDILDRLLPMLRQTAGAHAVDFRVQDVDLPARQATSLALVTNELVSNAIKHGRSRVEVAFEVGEGQAVLTVCDDGPGFPQGFSPTKSANTGLELVENLSRWDLGGHSIYANRPAGGASVQVVIPLARPASPAEEPDVQTVSPTPKGRALAGCRGQ
jgi:two-component sensor histidine kinase